MFKKNRIRIACVVLGFMILLTGVNAFAGIGDAQNTRELGKAMVSGLENVLFFKWIMAVLGVLLMIICGVLAVKELLGKNFAKGIGYAIGIIPGWYLSEWVIDIFKGIFQ